MSLKVIPNTKIPKIIEAGDIIYTSSNKHLSAVISSHIDKSSGKQILHLVLLNHPNKGQKQLLKASLCHLFEGKIEISHE